MKKFLYLIPFLALGLASCSSDEPLANGGDDNYNYNGENQYLTISINAAGASRADSDNYEDGTAEESAVSSVRFYFFTANGDPANVKVKGVDGGVNQWQSYYEVATPSVSDEDNDYNVTKIVDAQVIIDTDNNDKVPYSVVAVVNPSDELGTDNLSLAALSEKVRDYEALANATTNASFVMSNSIYADNFQQTVKEYGVRSYIKDTPDAAKQSPLELYVERAVAKVKMKLALADLTKVKTVDDYTIYDVSEPYDIVNMGTTDAALANGQPIYVKFLGWNVTCTANNANLIKNINPAWSADLFGAGGEAWNDASKFRSFWAINPSGVTFNHGNFGQGLAGSSDYQVQGKYAANKEVNSVGNFVYVQENAAKSDDLNYMVESGKHSKIIIAGQLVDGDGNPITLAEIGAQYYTLDGIKKLVANETNLWKKETVSGGTDGETTVKYVKIAPEDIDFITATAAGKVAADGTGTYYVYPVLKNTEVGDQFWYGDNQGTRTVSYSDARQLVMTVGPVKIWNEGLTYYFVDITHLGKPATDTASATAGYLGVVRNHVYDTEITSIKGLGTPVYDPNEEIIPEKPNKDRSVIAAKINILAWRIVKKSVGLEW